MNILISMPIGRYQSLLGRCLLLSREYAILKNSVINHIPADAREGNVVEILCGIDDAKLILDLASRVYPGATSHIEHAIRVSCDPEIGGTEGILRPAAPEYRIKTSGDTWHFCVNCSQWPIEDFISAKDIPGNGQICNECIVKEQHGENG